MRQAGGGKPGAHALGDGAIGLQRLRAAAQDAGVARLDAERRSVCRDVRPRLVNDADHAERHAHARDLDAARLLAPVGDGADRVGQGGDFFDATRHLLDERRREREPVDEGGIAPVRARLRDVAGIRREDLRLARANLVRHGGERAVLGLARGARHLARRRARRHAERAHRLRYVKLLLHRPSLAQGA